MVAHDLGLAGEMYAEEFCPALARLDEERHPRVALDAGHLLGVLGSDHVDALVEDDEPQREGDGRAVGPHAREDARVGAGQHRPRLFPAESDAQGMSARLGFESRRLTSSPAAALRA